MNVITLAIAAWLVIIAGVLVSPLIPLVVFGGLVVFVFVTGERGIWPTKR